MPGASRDAQAWGTTDPSGTTTEGERRRKRWARTVARQLGITRRDHLFARTMVEHASMTAQMITQIDQELGQGHLRTRDRRTRATERTRLLRQLGAAWDRLGAGSRPGFNRSPSRF